MENQNIQPIEENSSNELTISIKVDSEEAMQKLKLLEETIDRINNKMLDFKVDYKISGKDVIKTIERSKK